MQFQPMLLRPRAEAFDHSDWLFELKYDGFRALAFIDDGCCRLVSRNGNTFASFDGLALALSYELCARSAVLDGEIVCLDAQGRPQFADLLHRRREPIFVAFDLLAAEGQDFRSVPVIERKMELRRVLRPHLQRTLYCQHIERQGRALFDLACRHDLEGIVAKCKYGPYLGGRAETTWLKIRNRTYSQWEGRDEMFERPHEPIAGAGWDACTVAAVLVARVAFGNPFHD